MTRIPVRILAALGVLLAAVCLSRPAPAARLRVPLLLRDPFLAPAGAARPIAYRKGEAVDGFPNMVLPPNAGAGPPPFDPLPATATVRAVVLGSESRALVTVGAEANIVGVGDRLDGATITRITPVGVVLSNGSTLGLEGERR